MRNKFLSAFLIIIFFQSSLFSQNIYNLSQFGDESFRFIKQPLKWESNDWIKLGLFSAGTILLMQADKPIQDALLKDRSYNNSFPIEAGRIWGEVYPTVIIAGAFGLHGLIANDPSSKKIGFEIVQTALYAGAITTFLKFAAGRARPFANKGSATYHPFTIFDDDFHSLPSGHVTLAFSLSTVLSKNAKTDFLKIIAYLPAVLTAVSRVYQNNHWTSDVFIAASIGYFVGDWVTRQHEENDSPVQTSSIFPLVLRIKL
ncbi:MAG: phosphatase PAP2 family protein [Melioribacteraceae bacterium]